MSGPWEDYQPSQPSAERGPWEDYGGSSPVEVAPQQEEKGFFASIPEQMLKATPFGMASDMYGRGQKGQLLTPKEESQLRGVAMGASNLATGIPQYLANAAGMGEGINEAIRRKEEEYQAGREASGRTGFDAMRLAGNVIDPVAVLGMKGLSSIAPVITAGERIRQGAGIGGAIGLASPVTSGDDFEAEKNRQAGAGMAIGGAIPAGIAAAGGVYNTLKNITQPLRGDELVSRTAGRVARDAAGERADDVIAHLGRAKEGQTAGEAAVGAGSAEFEGLQRIARKQAPSEYLDLATKQTQLSNAEKQALDVVTGPMRRKALEAANIKGVQSANVISNIDNQLSEKGIRASDVVQKTLGGIKDKITSLSNENGVIDANDLYTIRKEVGNSIATFSKETSNWDKRLTSKLEGKIQKAIDDAIEKAGGRGWKQYLQEYSAGMKEIGSRDVATKTAKKMEIAGSEKAREIAGQDEIPISLPNILSRPTMIINAILRKAQGIGSEKTNAEIARLMRNPKELAAVMKAATPEERMILAKAFMSNTAISTGAQAAGRGIGSSE